MNALDLVNIPYRLERTLKVLVDPLFCRTMQPGIVQRAPREVDAAIGSTTLLHIETMFCRRLAELF